VFLLLLFLLVVAADALGVAVLEVASAAPEALVDVALVAAAVSALAVAVSEVVSAAAAALGDVDVIVGANLFDALQKSVSSYII
jgi:hypothetical protein